MDERAHDRVAIDRTVECRSFHGKQQVIVFNLSAAGYMLTMPTGKFSKGETLLLTLIGSTVVSGEVVWQKNSVCGISFRSHVPERIVSYLGYNAPGTGSSGA